MHSSITSPDLLTESELKRKREKRKRERERHSSHIKSNQPSTLTAINPLLQTPDLPCSSAYPRHSVQSNPTQSNPIQSNPIQSNPPSNPLIMPPRRPASSKDDKPPSLGLSGRPSNARGKVRVGGEAKPKDEDKIGIILDRILLGIGLLALGIGLLALVGLVLYFIGLVTNPKDKYQKRCDRLHHEAYAQAGAPVPETLHRSIQDDINMTNCPSATEGDYGLCMRNTFNHGQHEAPVTYFPEDVMKFFWNHRPRLLQARQASFISSLSLPSTSLV